MDTQELYGILQVILDTQVTLDILGYYRLYWLFGLYWLYRIYGNSGYQVHMDIQDSPESRISSYTIIRSTLVYRYIQELQDYRALRIQAQFTGYDTTVFTNPSGYSCCEYHVNHRIC